MAQKREELDYRKIVKTVLSLLKNQTAVEEIVTDFERAVWRTFIDLLPDVKVLGCAFHFTQAVFRNLKKK